MAEINLTMSALQVPGLDSYTEEFGTKKDSGVSLTTEEVCTNIALPFSQQRPVLVSESSSTGTVESDRKLCVVTGGIVLTLGSPAYAGCRLEIIGAFSGDSASVRWADSDGNEVSASLSNGQVLVMRADGDKLWQTEKLSGYITGTLSDSVLTITIN